MMINSLIAFHIPYLIFTVSLNFYIYTCFSRCVENRYHQKSKDQLQNKRAKKFKEINCRAQQARLPWTALNGIEGLRIGEESECRGNERIGESGQK